MGRGGETKEGSRKKGKGRSFFHEKGGDRTQGGPRHNDQNRLPRTKENTLLAHQREKKGTTVPKREGKGNFKSSTHQGEVLSRMLLMKLPARM